MNGVNLPDPTLINDLEAVNLYLEWNRAWVDLYLNFYKFYLPK
jgi:hypothetical protein